MKIPKPSSQHPSIAEQHAQWCVHYQRDPGKMFGQGDERCKAGVSYDELARVAS